VANGTGEGKARRSYRPAVESLDALRLPSGAPQTLPGLAAAYDLFGPASAPTETHAPAVSDATWDTALVDHEIADAFDAAWQSVQDEDVAAGLAQLDRYLSRTWYRAGVVLQQHDDCSQAVYATLLLLMGRDRFDELIGDVGRRGIRNVLNRETHVGPDFFRAVDAVKKRARRARRFQPLDAIDVADTARDDATRASWRHALHEAIERTLSQREAALIDATLKGETPAEIALRWGVAPKTVSNEKTRVIQKLRGVLVGDHPD
jgi:RNA polymerase sigma factor (sigma-70 family)